MVALALADTVAFDLAIPAQIFGHRDESDRYHFSVSGIAAGNVSTTTGFAIVSSAGLDALDTADTVVVPGFRPLDAPPPAALDALRAAAGRGARVISICTGAFALAFAGLLDGHRATTHWRDADDLARRFPAVDVDPDVLFVDEGHILTSAGVAAEIDLCLHLVRRDYGAAHATRIAHRMVTAPFRAGGQAQFLERPIPRTGGPAISDVCAWALERLDQRLTVDDLATEAGLAPRTLARRWVSETGLTPLRWLTVQRLHESRRLLETTDMTVEAIAHKTGIGSAAHLRELFARETRTTPSAYRTSHRGG